MESKTKRERGVSMVIVLVLLTVVLLSGLTFMRMTQVGTLAGGNTAYRAAAVQASDVGLDVAFAAVRGMTVDQAASDWYFPTIQETNTDGVPKTADFDAAGVPSVVVDGQYTVKYVVERMCNTTTVTDSLRECLVKRQPEAASEVGSAIFGKESFTPPNSIQYRVTLRVTGPKSTQTFVQSLVTRGT